MSYLDSMVRKQKQSKNSASTKQITKKVKQKTYAKYNAKRNYYSTGSRVRDRMSTATYFSKMPENPNFKNANANLRNIELHLTGGRNKDLLFNKSGGGKPLANGAFSAPLYGKRKTKDQIADAYKPGWVFSNGNNHITKKGKTMRNLKLINDNEANNILKPSSGPSKKVKKKGFINKVSNVFDFLNTVNYSAQGAVQGGMNAYDNTKSKKFDSKQLGKVWGGIKRGANEGFKAGTSSDKKGRYTWYNTLMAGDRLTQNRLKRDGKYSTSDMMSPALMAKINNGEIDRKNPKKRTSREQDDVDRSASIAGIGLDVGGAFLSGAAASGKILNGSDKLSKLGNKVARASDLTIDFPILSLLRGSGKGYKYNPQKINPSVVAKGYKDVTKDISGVYKTKSNLAPELMQGNVVNYINKTRGVRNIDRGVKIGGLDVLSPKALQKVADSKFNVPGRLLNNGIALTKNKKINKTFNNAEVEKMLTKEVSKVLNRGGFEPIRYSKAGRNVFDPNKPIRNVFDEINVIKPSNKPFEYNPLNVSSKPQAMFQTDKKFKDYIIDYKNTSKSKSNKVFSGDFAKDKVAREIAEKNKTMLALPERRKQFINKFENLHKEINSDDIPQVAKIFSEARNSKSPKKAIDVLNKNFFDGQSVLTKNASAGDVRQFIDYMEDGLNYKILRETNELTGKGGNFLVRDGSKVHSFPLIDKKTGKYVDWKSKYSMMSGGLVDKDYWKKVDLADMLLGKTDSKLSKKLLKQLKKEMDGHIPDSNSLNSFDLSDLQKSSLSSFKSPKDIKSIETAIKITHQRKDFWNEVKDMNMNEIRDFVSKNYKNRLPNKYKVNDKIPQYSKTSNYIVSKNGSLIDKTTGEVLDSIPKNMPESENLALLATQVQTSAKNGNMTKDQYNDWYRLAKSLNDKGENKVASEIFQTLKNANEKKVITEFIKNPTKYDDFKFKQMLYNLGLDPNAKNTSALFDKMVKKYTGVNIPSKNKLRVPKSSEIAKGRLNRKPVKYKIKSNSKLMDLSKQTLDDIDYNFMVRNFDKEMKTKYPKDFKDPSKFEQITDKILKPYDFLTREFKAGTTIARPGWHGNNFIQNKMLNAYGAGSDVLNQNMRNVSQKTVNAIEGSKKTLGKKYGKQFEKGDLNKLLNIDGKMITNANGSPVTIKDFIEGIKASGLTEDTFLKNVSNKTNKDIWKYALPTGDKSIWTLGGQHNNIRTESYDKVQQVLSQMKQGKTFDEGVNKAYKYLFDYNDVNKFEEKVMKRIMPFYTYHSKNIPLQFEQFLENPKFMNTYYRALRGLDNTNKDDDKIDRDEWTYNRVQIPGFDKVSKDRNGNEKNYGLLWNPSTPYDSFTNPPTVNGKGNVDNIPSYNPLAESAIRYFGTGKDFFGNKFDEKNVKGFSKYLAEQYLAPTLGVAGEIAKQYENPQTVTNNDALVLLKLLAGPNVKYYKDAENYNFKGKERTRNEIKRNRKKITLYNKK